MIMVLITRNHIKFRKKKLEKLTRPDFLININKLTIS